MSTLLFDAFEVPGGLLTVVVDPAADGDRPMQGAVVAASFRGLADAITRVPGADPEPGDLVEVDAALKAYLAGDFSALDSVSAVQPGGPFQQRAWSAMRDIPAGAVASYAELAERAGSPQASRAAGTACSSNLIPVLIPCHRIVASHGPGGYGYGLEVKRALLAHEGVELS